MNAHGLIEGLIRIIDAEVATSPSATAVDLRRRASKLLERPELPRGLAARANTAVEVEFEEWSAAILRTLLPGYAEQVSRRLTSIDGSSPTGTRTPQDVLTPWWRLDDVVAAEVDARRSAEASRSACAIVAEAGRYAASGKLGALKEAVRQAEIAMQPLATLPRVFAEDADSHRARLQAALDVLPVRARNAFVSRVRGSVEKHPLWTSRPDGDHWLSSERWIRVGTRWDDGPFFVEELQHVYETEREDARRHADGGRTLEQSRGARAGKDHPAGSTPVVSDVPKSVQPMHALPEYLDVRGRMWTVERPPTEAEFAAMDPKDAARIRGELAFHHRHDAELARRRADKEEYERQLIERAY
jgi:hypothetical protein